MDIPPVTKEERKALEAMQRGKAAKKDQVSADLLKDGEEIVLKRLPALHKQYLKSQVFRYL